jgi:hypothetical protein
MAKFFAVYRVPVAMSEEWQKNTKPEEMKAQMDKMMADMQAWTAKNQKSLVEAGLPLGKTKSVTAGGIADTRNDLNFYCVVEADSHTAAAQMFADSPHLQIPSSSIDVMEIPHMGM